MDAEMVRLAKFKLRIADSDNTDDAYIDELLADAEQVVRDLLGIGTATVNFAEPGGARELILSRVFYAYHDAEDDWEKNYDHIIQRERQKRMVSQYDAQTQAD